ncbi:hypothetical protein [Komagataeibacter saccharivorans]|uniref:hypothetical protein n=1 Tax=Komagataeibacter saccharivorans TaxID=265959 RepID=UPI0039E83C0F
MRHGRSLLLAAIGFMAAIGSARAHRLDEYMQATVIDVARRHITVTVRLTPGVDVASGVIRQIDSNADGILSAQEQKRYTDRVRQGLQLDLNGHPLSLTVAETLFPPVTTMQTGNGTIILRLDANVELIPGSYRLVYANHGAGTDTVYLVNGLLPHDPAIHIQQQRRSPDQASYGLDFSVSR